MLKLQTRGLYYSRYLTLLQSLWPVTAKVLNGSLAPIFWCPCRNVRSLPQFCIPQHLTIDSLFLPQYHIEKQVLVTEEFSPECSGFNYLSGCTISKLITSKVEYWHYNVPFLQNGNNKRIAYFAYLKSFPCFPCNFKGQKDILPTRNQFLSRGHGSLIDTVQTIWRYINLKTICEQISIRTSYFIVWNIQWSFWVWSQSLRDEAIF